MEQVALVIIYNHQFNKNIEILESLYKTRFSNIYHLVPFYCGEKSNVIPVYDSSHYFQGYIAQGFKSFYKEKYTHFFFVADDLLLNPIINEANYSDIFKLNPEACFLPEVITLHERQEWWSKINHAYLYNVNQPGVEAKNQLPEYDVAIKEFDKFGIEIKPLSFNQIWKTPASIKEWRWLIVRDTFSAIRCLKSKFSKREYRLSYPLVGAYSDIFIVSSDSIKKFIHYCGVFSATKLFVEIAIPTSMVLASNELVTEKELELQGRALWSEGDFDSLVKYEYDLNKLFDNFPENHLYLHPIKLSKWKVNFE